MEPAAMEQYGGQYNWVQRKTRQINGENVTWLKSRFGLGACFGSTSFWSTDQQKGNARLPHSEGAPFP